MTAWTFVPVRQKATRDDPVHRDGLCAVSGCKQYGSELRCSAGGFWVRYCVPHDWAAALHFDRIDEDAA